MIGAFQPPGEDEGPVPMSLKDKYAIVGAATTRFGKLPNSTAEGLTVEAAKLAIEDSGIDKAEAAVR